MKTSSTLIKFVSLAAVCAMVSSCATQVASDVVNIAQNPPPSEAFSNFTAFEIEPVTLGEVYKGQEANEKALIKIQENLDLRTVALLKSWNQVASDSDTTRTLRFTPKITEIKFISGGARFWAGAMAGSSIVVIKLEVLDVENNTLIGEPEFYSKANAYAGAYSIGGADNAMLVRIANRVGDYISGNYDEAVGGATGSDV
jgi:hypothetical protein